MKRAIILAAGLGLVIGSFFVPAAAQTPTPAAPHQIPRTADGKPNLRGAWRKAGGNFDEANPIRPLFTTECADFFLEKAEPKGFTNVGLPRARPQYAPPAGRPQGIVDPPDKKLPYTAYGLAKRQEFIRKIGPPAESLEWVELTARCAPPAPWQGSEVEILQRSGQVVFLFENDHTSRVVYTDGRPHLDPSVHLFGGDSVGHWEGDTLVVDTRNVNGLGHFGGGVARTIAPLSDALHITERFTMVAPKLIDYEMIFDDPKIFTHPVKSAGYFFPVDDGYEIMEITCVEGSTTLRNIFGF